MRNEAPDVQRTGAAMALFSVEHSRSAYWADFGIYGTAVAALGTALTTCAPRGQGLRLGCLVVLGVAAWTLIEYLLHRFVLHGLEPFRSWHVAHHRRPTALMSTPTLLSVALILALVFLPALLAVHLWPAAALTLGVVVGYLAYSVTHHATHHWRSFGPWMTRRKRWHARHHRGAACYGVTCAFWDRMFRSTGDTRPSTPPSHAQ